VRVQELVDRYVDVAAAEAGLASLAGISYPAPTPEEDRRLARASLPATALLSDIRARRARLGEERVERAQALEVELAALAEVVWLAHQVASSPDEVDASLPEVQRRLATIEVISTTERRLLTDRDE
jgi:hypothetical protein